MKGLEQLAQLDPAGCANALNTSLTHGLSRYALQRIARTTAPTAKDAFSWKSWLGAVCTWYMVAEWVLLAGVVVACSVILACGYDVDKEYTICSLSVAAFMVLLKLKYVGACLYREFFLSSQLAQDSKFLAQQVCVRRDGALRLVPHEELHVGDMLTCVRGQVVPANCRVVKSTHCFVSEFALTAREEWVEKVATKQSLEELTGSVLPRNVVYAGSCIMAGSCECIVVSLAESIADRSARKEMRLAQMGRVADESVDTSVPTELWALQKYVWLAMMVSGGVAIAVDVALSGSDVAVDVEWTFVFAACVFLVVLAPTHLATAHNFAVVHALKQADARGIVIRRPKRTLDALSRVNMLLVEEESLLTSSQYRTEVASTASSTQMKVIALPGYSLRNVHVNHASNKAAVRARHSISDRKSPSKNSPSHGRVRDRSAPSDGSTPAIHFPKSDAQAQCLLALFEQVIGSSPFLVDKLRTPPAASMHEGAAPNASSSSSRDPSPSGRRRNDSIIVTNSSSSAALGSAVESSEDVGASMCDEWDTAVLSFAFRVGQMSSDDAENFHHILSLAVETVGQTTIKCIEPALRFRDASGDLVRTTFEEGRVLTVTRESHEGEDASAVLLEDANTSTDDAASVASGDNSLPPPYKIGKPTQDVQKKNRKSEAKRPVLVESFRGDASHVLDCCDRMVVPTQSLEQKEGDAINDNALHHEEEHVHGSVQYVKLTTRTRHELKKLAAHLGSMQMRVLAFAKRAEGSGGGVFCGFLGCLDSPCTDVSAEIRAVLDNDSNMRLHVLSRDSHEFALSLSDKCGLAGAGDQLHARGEREGEKKKKERGRDPIGINSARKVARGVLSRLRERDALPPSDDLESQKSQGGDWTPRRVRAGMSTHESGTFIQTSKHSGNVVCYCTGTNRSLSILNEADVSVSVGHDAHAVRASADVVLSDASQLQTVLTLGREYKQGVVCGVAIELAHRVNLLLLCVWSVCAGYGLVASGGCLMVVECMFFTFTVHHLNPPSSLPSESDDADSSSSSSSSMRSCMAYFTKPAPVPLLLAAHRSFFSKSFAWVVLRAFLLMHVLTLPVFVVGFHLEHFEAWPDSGFNAASVQAMTFVSIMVTMGFVRRMLIRGGKASWGHVIFVCVIFFELSSLVGDPHMGPLISMVTLSQQGVIFDPDTPVLGLMSVPVLVCFGWPLLGIATVLLFQLARRTYRKRAQERTRLRALNDYHPLNDI